MDENDPVIMYILMRNDLASMTPGRACAQATHAANSCIYEVKDYRDNHNDKVAASMLYEWENETKQNFGTTIVLGVNGKELEALTTDKYEETSSSCLEKEESTIYYNSIIDPEYGVKDGNVIHYISLRTCGYFFGRKKDVAPYISHLNLY